jgi:hypothetical protein
MHMPTYSNAKHTFTLGVTMNRQTSQIPSLFLFCFMLISMLGSLGCSSAVPLISDWKKSEIVIDGKQNDWEGSLYDLKKVNVTIGVRNDSENLYLCFISYDQGVGRQIMSGGFTIWFDPSGGTDEQYGIKFPVGRPKGSRAQMPDKNSGGENNPPGDFGSGDNAPPMPGNDNSAYSSRGENDDKMMSMLLNAQRELQFLGPEEKDVQQASTLELKTAKVQIGMTQKAFVYELQVPLQKTIDFPFTLTPTDKKNILGIEFKTEENSMVRMGGPGGGPGGPGGGGPPSGGGPGGPPGGGPGGPPGGGQGGPPPSGGRGGKGSNSSEPIDIWSKVTLAQSPTAATTR